MPWQETSYRESQRYSSSFSSTCQSFHSQWEPEKTSKKLEQFHKIDILIYNIYISKMIWWKFNNQTYVNIEECPTKSKSIYSNVLIFQKFFILINSYMLILLIRLIIKGNILGTVLVCQTRLQVQTCYCLYFPIFSLESNWSLLEATSPISINCNPYFVIDVWFFHARRMVMKTSTIEGNMENQYPLLTILITFL